MSIVKKIKDLRERDELEFKYQLRNLLKKSQTEGLTEFKNVIKNFKREIIYDSFFFVDIINEALYYFFLSLKEEEGFDDIMDIIYVIAPIGDKDTLELLSVIIKKLPSLNRYYPLLMNYYGEIEHKISFLEQKISKLKLYPLKSMITEWYE